MKKYLGILIVLMFAFVLAGCQDTTTTTTTTSNTTTTTTTTSSLVCETNQTEVEGVCVDDSTVLTDLIEDFSLEVDLSQVSTDMTLPTVLGNATIAWSSDKPAVISQSGVVQQSLTGNETVTLTATITYKNETETVTFTVTVLKELVAPVITVPEDGVIEMTLGNVDSLALVSADDANDGDLLAQVTITGTYDVNKAGYYDVTLTVTDSDNQTTTQQAKLHVIYPAPIIVTGETWGVAAEDVKSLVVFDVIENITDGQVFNIALADGVVSGPTLFHNTTDGQLTFSVINAYGVAAVFNANGVVVEGRDGANGRLVDDSCGLRTLCQQGSLEASNPLSNFVVEAGGYVLVAPNMNTDYNQDGRKFINEQVINRLERVVPMTMNEENLYTYQDQAPYVVIGGKIQPSGSFTMTFTKSVTINLFENIKIYDDNGAFGPYTELVKTETFNPVVSVKLYDAYGTEIVVSNPNAFVFENEGVYDAEITITDGTNQKLIESQFTVVVFEELSSPAFRITGTLNDAEFEYIDLMKVSYTYNFDDTNDLDTAKYHIYDNYQALLNDTTLAPHKMGWGSFIIFDGESGIIEVNYNIFKAQLYVAPGVTYIDAALFTDAEGLKGITDLPAGKILLVGPQGTDLRAFALSSTSRNLTGLKLEFINVPEVPSIVPQYNTSTVVINYNETAYPIEITGYAYNPTHAGTNNFPTGKVELFTNYQNILGLDGTPLNMGWGSYLIIDMQTKVIEVYGNWGNVFKLDSVDYVDPSVLNGATVLDTITSLPEGKLLIVSPQGTDLRTELYNTIGNNSNITNTTIGLYEIYEVSSFVIEYNQVKYAIDLTGYQYNPTHAGTNNMPTGKVEFFTNYQNILGLDGTPLNMGYGSYIILDQATMTIEVYANWANVFKLDTVDYVDASLATATTVLDSITSLPEGKLLIVNPQGTTMRDQLHNGIGSNSDITGLTVGIYLVPEIN